MLSNSPHGSVMSCQSLATRAFPEPDKDSMTHSVFHRSVRFSSESRSSVRTRATSETECKKDTSGSISLSALATTPVCSQSSAMSQSVPNNSATFNLDDMQSPPTPSCRFPKLEECAHFHYDRVSLGGLSIEVVPCQQKGEDWTPGEGWICLKVRSHVNSSCDESIELRAVNSSWSEATEDKEWTLTRNMDNLLQLDDLLHRCIYDRKVSNLPNLSEKISHSLLEDEAEYRQLISDYVHHLSIIADDSINCGPVLNWLQMDNKGHKLLVANEDSSSINTPAVAAAYSVRKYVSQARDEISFEVGDMISIIDMPGPQESLWWRGKRGFRVGFFPHHCVAVIGDKVPRHMTQPPPIVGSVAVASIKPVLRKHGKLISLFRSFILSRPSRRSLKQQGILKERVFGCDLGEHLLNCGHDVPSVLVECAAAIEARGAVDGIYRLSGGSGLTQRLRVAFDQGESPDLTAPQVVRDPHAVSSLLKMYFRELPNPLCTYQLYDSFVSAAQQQDEGSRLRAMRSTLIKLPPPHYRTLAYLMRHLRRVSLLGASTGMTARNMAIVWAPNLLRSPCPQHALQGVAVQAVITEFLICYAEDLFAQEQADSGPDSLEQEVEIELRGQESSGRRPKSLPLNPPTKLLSLEEARRRGNPSAPQVISPRLPPPSGAIAAAAHTQLRPEGHLKPKYIEVGSGPNNLPQYHTVLDLPAPGTKRGLKRSPSGWRGLFSRSKLQRYRGRPTNVSITPPEITLLHQDSPMQCSSLRPVKSCESLASDTDTLAPLNDRISAPLKHHTRSASCDSYFEPWQAELADMRLRLSPQERDRHMFSEEDDTQQQHNLQDSLCSSPAESGECSVDPSPRRNLRVDIDAANDLAERKRTALEDQIAEMVFIDGDSPRSKPAAEKRHCAARPASPHPVDVAKRVCKDRESPLASQAEFQSSISNVKLRERSSPRKGKNASRYSNVHHINMTEPITVNSRLSWQGKDGHSTLIKIDWPENSSVSNLTNSTIQSSPITPITPLYDTLESDSEASTANKHTIKIQNDDCQNCVEEKCLKCELKATDYENVNNSADISPLMTNISYQNLNRLSASSNSENEKKNYENCDALPVMTSSHESSSSFSNMSPSKENDELYECYNFVRPNYINLQSSSTSKSSNASPLRSPLKSTISITFRSPTKTNSPEYELIENTDTPTNERDSVYEDIDLDKNLSIVEEASVPQFDASLPTQQACQPESLEQDLIILETPTEEPKEDDIDVYSQVKFFKKSIDEVNAMILESPEKDTMEPEIEKFDDKATESKETRTVEEFEKISIAEPSTSDDKASLESTKKEEPLILEPIERKGAISLSPDPETREKINPHYENVDFDLRKDYVNVDTLKICDKQLEISKHIDNTTAPKHITLEKENGNIIKPKVSNLNVRELANRFESPTEQKGPFNFEKVKYSTLDRKEDIKNIKRDLTIKLAPPLSLKTYTLAKNSCTARSLDENAFVKEFGNDKSTIDRRKSFEVREAKKQSKFLPDLNLNMEENETSKEIVTPTSENKISLIQKPDIKNIIPFDTEKKLSRERIEKYKEERRNFLREKYSSQSFRSNPEQLTRIKIKKEEEKSQNVTEDLPKFERRNTVDLGQRMRFSLTKSSNNIDIIQSPTNLDKAFEEVTIKCAIRKEERKEKVSPSYNIRDMTAMFEEKFQNNG